MNEIEKVEIWRRTLEAIHDNAVDAIITIDPHGVIESVNPSTERIFGHATSELIGRNIRMLMPSPFREKHDGYIDSYLKSGIPQIIGIGREVLALRKDGRVFPVHLAVCDVRQGGRRVFAGFIRDLSDFKIIEQQRAMLGRIIEDSVNEVYVFDAQTFQFVRVNRGARENLGYTHEEMCQLTPLDLKPEFTRDSFERLIQPLRTKKRDKIDFHTTHRRKDGSTYDVDVHLHISDYQGQEVFVAIILDVTRRRQAERELQRQQQVMQAELERLVETRTQELQKAQAELIRSEKYSTLGKVAGGIAHEIRNPLNAVKTSAYFLLNARTVTPEKTREHLERIDRQVTQIDHVITALSDVARLPEAELASVYLPPVLRELVRSIGLPEQISAVFDLPDELPNVLADTNQIVIAFRNIVRNARDAMPNGGTLTVSGVVDGSYVVFSISDTGIGIAEHELPKILEPLYTTKARGMGIGLSITRAIVEKNQGQLTAASRLGEGSRFSIHLKKTN